MTLIDPQTGIMQMAHPGIRYFLKPVADGEKCEMRSPQGGLRAEEFTFPSGARKAMFDISEPFCGQREFLFYALDGTPVWRAPGETWTAPNGEVLS
jgi:hypothetical protein